MPNKKEGFVYIASGSKFIEEAKTSAKSVKNQMPDASITLYCDSSVDSELFDNVVNIKEKNWDIDKMGDSYIRPKMIPYDKNIFLDTDTYLTDDVSELFELLDRFDLAACKAPGYSRIKDTPECVREFNTGVVAYKDNQKIKTFLENWVETHIKLSKEELDVGRNNGNQHSFTKAVFDSDIDFFTLSRNYNLRVPYSDRINSKVKIVHGRCRKNLPTIAEKLNSRETARVYYSSQSLIGSGVKIKDERTRSYRIQELITVATSIFKKEGFLSLISRTNSYIINILNKSKLEE